MKRKQRNDNKVQAKATQPDSVRFVDIIIIIYYYAVLHTCVPKKLCMIYSDQFSRANMSHEQVDSRLNVSAFYIIIV